MSEVFRIYLAGPVKYESDNGDTWRQQAVKILKQATADKDYVVKIINPNDFFSYEDGNAQSDRQIKQYYMDQILHSRLVLVSLDGTNTSPGTSAELQFAEDHGIQVIGFETGREVYNWCKISCQCTFSSLLSAISYICDHYLN
jgi:nucleoside 2-deoxyribosyltransferase